MGRFTIEEDRPTPPEVYSWRPYLFAMIASLGAMLYGYDSAFIGGTLALSSFREEFGINTDNAAALSANIVSTYQAGAAVGALLAFPFCDRFGRKITVLVAGYTFTAGAAIHFASHSGTGLGGIYAGRVIGGLGVGMISLVVPIYLAEISPPAIRGRLTGLYELLLQIGGLIGFWINYGVTQHVPYGAAQWRIPIGVQLIPGGLLCIVGFFLVESPRWLRARGLREEAEAVLAKLRNLPSGHQYMVEEWALVDDQLAIEEEKVGTGKGAFIARLRELTLPGIRNRLGICFMLFLFQNATGINAINYYSPTVFKSVGITGTNTSLLTTGVFGVIKTTTTLIWLLFLIDNLGRRRLFLFGAAGAAFCMLYVALIIRVTNPSGTGSDGIKPSGISAVAFLFIWTAIYGPTWNGTPWCYCAEVFPQHVRAIAQSLLSFSQWLWQFAIARATPYMFRDMHAYGPFFFFGSATILAFIFVFFAVPETKGLPIERMDEIFGTPKDLPHVRDVEMQKQQDYRLEHSSQDVETKAST
ncbi:hypothetical protein JCM8547_002598 [Rhodosporidiobolus lusitaniae]